jgi:allantoinase
MQFDIAIQSNRVITPNGIKAAAILIKDGVTIDVVDKMSDQQNVIDAGNKVIMPGIIDPHVHINEPGRTEWEGFATASKAALAGGITTLVDMPLNSSPVTTTANALDQKLAALQKLHNSGPHIHFWGGIIPGNTNDIEPLIEKGVPGFKAFLTHSGIDEFPNVTEADLDKAMPIIAKYNLPLLVHCELSDDQHHSALDANPQSYKAYLQSRPEQWEDDAIQLVIRLCEKYNCRTHIVHLSSANSIQPIAQAKQKGLPLTVETAQHYLYFNAENIPDAQTAYKCAPPIRERSNNEQLWQALKNGIIDFVATDHSPAPPALKEIESGNLQKAWGGIASLQLALPILWTAARRHNYSLENMAKWLCENPAIFLRQQTGKIAKGYDADIIVWDPDTSFTVTENMLHHRHKITPYMNERLFGVVEQTWVRGKRLYDREEDAATLSEP